MSLDISSEIENVIRERAQAAGLSVNDLLARAFTSEVMATRPSTDPKEHVRALLTRWRAQDNTPVLPPIPTQNGETPTQALFRNWEEEDANMTEEEQEREAMYWEQFQQSIDVERTKAGMRTLS